MARFVLLLTALGIISLAACQRMPDIELARTCRSVLPAINPPGARVDVLSTSAVGETAIEVVYSAHARDAPPRQRRLTCTFAPSEWASGRLPEIETLISDGERIGPVRIALLRRFWLSTPEGTAADPAPYILLWPLPELAPWVAAGLQQFVSALPMISIYALLAPAYALVYGLIGRINLAFGEFAAVAAYGALLGTAIASGWGMAAPALLALTLGLWSAAVHGLAASRLIFSHLSRSSGQHALIATIGLALALQEYLRLFQGSALRWVAPVLNQPVALAKSDAFVVTLTPMATIVTGLALAAATALLLTMQRSRFGRLWRACADDRSAAMLVGVDPDAVLSRTFVLACVMAGLAGVIVTGFYGGLGYAGGIVLGLKSLIAAVAGGIGSVPGAFLGGILIGGAEALWSALFPIEYRDVAIYSLLAALLIWRPGGL
ncbi:MAG TPA: branched-chain amino acid ABC transporter permease, partial [Hyphomicrobiaceae bacterium]|nr:branched-chain amino acid ABC transporter permease [Hyphomicrobiaceae bacterium]